MAFVYKGRWGSFNKLVVFGTGVIVAFEGGSLGHSPNGYLKILVCRQGKQDARTIEGPASLVIKQLFVWYKEHLPVQEYRAAMRARFAAPTVVSVWHGSKLVCPLSVYITGGGLKWRTR